MLEWYALSAQRFELPVDGISEIEVPETEQIEPAVANTVRLFNYLLRGLGPARFEFSGGLFRAVEACKECWFRSRTEMFEQIVSRMREHVVRRQFDKR